MSIFEGMPNPLNEKYQEEETFLGHEKTIFLKEKYQKDVGIWFLENYQEIKRKVKHYESL